jgi:hypothetical protein
MGWNSTTYKKSVRSADKSTKEAVAVVVDKYRTAMSKVVREAREIADDRRKTLERIKDSELKRSAKR